MKFDLFRLFQILPATLRVAWGFILIGFLALTAGNITASTWQSFGGIGCLVMGYIVSIIDVINPKRPRGESARVGFYAGISGATLMALMGVIVFALLVVIVFAVASFTDSIASPTALRSLHFIGMLFAFLVVIGLPSIALKVKNSTETEQGGGGQPATRP